MAEKKNIQLLRIGVSKYDTVEDLEKMLGKLRMEIGKAFDANEPVKAHALAYNIINVMREIEREKHLKEKSGLAFKVRDIVINALDGSLDHEEALKRLRKLVT